MAIYRTSLKIGDGWNVIFNNEVERWNYVIILQGGEGTDTVISAKETGIVGGTISAIGEFSCPVYGIALIAQDMNLEVTGVNLEFSDVTAGIVQLSPSTVFITNDLTRFESTNEDVGAIVTDLTEGRGVITINSKEIQLSAKEKVIDQNLNGDANSDLNLNGEKIVFSGKNQNHSVIAFNLQGKGSKTEVSGKSLVFQEEVNFSHIGDGAILNLSSTNIAGNMEFMSSSGKLFYGFKQGVYSQDSVSRLTGGFLLKGGSLNEIHFGTSSVFTGYVDTDDSSSSTLKLTGSTWNVVKNPNSGLDWVSKVTHVILNDSKIDLTSSSALSTSSLRSVSSPYLNLVIGNLSSNNGVFVLDVDIKNQKNDSVTITNTASGQTFLDVASSGTGTGKEDSGILVHAPTSTGNLTFSLTPRLIDGQMRELIDEGIYLYQLASKEASGEKQWYLAPFTEALIPDEPKPDPDVPNREPTPIYSPTAEAVLAMAGMGAQSGFYQNQLTDVRKRLGEIRGGVRDGLWASVAGQKDRLSGFAGTNFKQDVYRFNFGADAVVGDWILGGNFKYINADQKTRDTYFKAKGEAHSEGVNLYATWQNEKGCYADFILSADRYHQRINNTMLDGTGVKGTYRNLGLGVSAEIGKKFTLDKAQNWFAEPQLQLSYYHVKGDDFTMSNGMKVKQGNFNSLTGRLGVATGYEVKDPAGKPKGQVYLRTGLKHEFLGKQTLHVNDVKFRDNLVGTRAYYGLATDWNLSKNLKVYGHVERENGSQYTKEIEVMAGVKYSF